MAQNKKMNRRSEFLYENAEMLSVTAQKLLGTTCGVFGEPAGVTGTAAVKKLCEQGVLGENDTVVSVVTGNGLKDVANAIKFCGEPMSLPNDLDLLVEEFDKRGIKTEAYQTKEGPANRLVRGAFFIQSAYL